MIGTAIAAAAAFILAGAQTAWGQGQDGTPAERDIMVIAEMFPGRYDNANQNYFDVRRNLTEDLRHPRVYATVDRIDLPAFGAYVFWVQATRGRDGEPYLRRIYALEVDNRANAVRMKMYIYDGPEHAALTDAHSDLSKLDGLTPETALYEEGCDVLWRREPGQFNGRTDLKTCRRDLAGVGEANVDFHMFLSPDALWVLQRGFDDDGNQIYGNTAGDMYQLSRARTFNCYADIPGVSGGRDEPFDRYEIRDLHDMGGIKWFEAEDGREIGVILRNVEWPINNEVGAFTRNSLVLYLLERTEDGIKELTYSWTEPRAERIGINMLSMLVNCYMVSNRDVAPFFGKQPRR